MGPERHGNRSEVGGRAQTVAFIDPTGAIICESFRAARIRLNIKLLSAAAELGQPEVGR